MNSKVVFGRLGFGKNAYKVYSALFKSRGPLLTAHIATKAGLDRPEVYRQLPSLIGRGLIKEIPIGKRKGYLALSPRRISEEFLKDAKKVAKFNESLARERVKELPDYMSHFRGASGIRAVFDDVVDRTSKGETFYRYTSEKDLAAVNRYLSPQYRMLRDKKKLERLVISNPLSGSQKRPRLERFIKYIPPETDLFDHNIIQIIYADSLAFINLTKEDAFIIRDKSLAQFQTIIFKQLYKKL